MSPEQIAPSAGPDRVLAAQQDQHRQLRLAAGADKELQWIEGTMARFDGYLGFQRRPQPILDWFVRYMP